ncbi:hypothetical protein WS97_04820 [Burkholderia territorii]|uniref:SDR family NAD(P)-dependent oxidoreductase n=1 Tax=Burkholderia territorii TaxID=1503055 RepID=UPI000753EC25|nr:SDR family NAD(P)-dependent oxidoreductase [Burkholderia territorii]KVL40797.1 hypothetical protein WS97_04820 [Burkholderia territorii]
MNDNGFPPGAVLVFGGSGGIGQGVALEFARAGVPVAPGYRSKADVAERVARDLHDTGVAATAHRADVTDPAQIDTHSRVHTNTSVALGARFVESGTPPANGIVGPHSMLRRA